MEYAKKSIKAKGGYRKLDEPSSWRKHDTYSLGASYNRPVTRSQTGFLRVKNTKSDLELFADSRRHQPPGEPHLMEVMKGKYGSIPKIIITRSTGQYLSISNYLCKKLAIYKLYEPEKDGEEPEKELPPIDKEKPEEPAQKASSKKLSIFRNLLAKKSVSKNADVKTSSKETIADVKTPSKETMADVKTPSKETVVDMKTPSKETVADVTSPSEERTTDVKTFSKERAIEQLPPIPQSDFAIQKQSLGSDF